MIKPFPWSKEDKACDAGNFLGEFAVILFTRDEESCQHFYKNYEKLAKQQKNTGKNLIGTDKLVKYGVVENPSVRNRGDKKIRFFCLPSKAPSCFPNFRFQNESCDCGIFI